MIKSIAFLLCMAIPFLGFAQDVVVEQATTTSSTLKAATELPNEGTYQIIVKGPEQEVVIPEETLLQVNQERKNDEDVLLAVSDKISIKILSWKKIRAKEFVAPKKYIYKD